MPEKDNDSQNLDSLVQPFFQFWSSCLDQTNKATKTMLEGGFGQAGDQNSRRESFDAMSKHLDDYLRGPTFLQAMKHHIDSLIQAKRAGNDTVAETGETDSTAIGNVQEMLQRLHNTELTIMNRLDRIEHRLGTIETHIDISKSADQEAKDAEENVDD